MCHKTKEVALIYSGATKNFLNIEVWKSLNIRQFKLDKLLTVYNVDGTENCQGKIDSYCLLKIHYQGKMLRMKFYLTRLGKDYFILGYPFLFMFNPFMDW